MKHKGSRCWESHVGIRKGKVIEPQGSTCLQTGYWEFRHSSQKNEGTITSEDLDQWHKALPRLDAGSLIDPGEFLPQIHHSGHVSGNPRLGHLSPDGVYDGLYGRELGRVGCSIDVGLEHQPTNENGRESD